MDFYLDFEATQFKNNIIAIGCSCKYGEFDCLVRPPRKDHITPFITQLTGINKELAASALSAEDAFVDFFSWVNEMLHEDISPAFFHVYGDMDKVFLEKTAEQISGSFVRQQVLNLAESVIDDSKRVRQFFMVKSIGVHQALQYFIPELEDQNHDPLDDALMLQSLMQFINNSEPLTDCPFPEKQRKPKVPQNNTPKKPYYIKLRHATDDKAKSKQFPTTGAAITWAYTKISNSTPEAKRSTVEKNVKKAIDKKTPYMGWYFDKIEFEEEEVNE